ncbi:hypothetical protein T08_13083 [Trichinella sp. T8]|nr:hypothetical protein T08_13083 [Trichinella sp. T8]
MTPCQVLCTDLLLIEQQVFLQNRFYLTAATLWCITVKIIAKNGWTIPKFQSNRLSLNEFVTMFLLFKTASEEGILKLNFYNLLLWLKVDAIEFHVTLS